ncbi:MAG TPA: baseplate J/gp47 family protein, partial [Ktedonobacteraceae bacterium]|nr:baseplate J/gp47 family protein [Ktedonobacteraceae bacterium]
AGVVLSQRVSIRDVPGIGWELHDTLRGQHWLAVPEKQGLSFNTFSKWRLRRDLLSSDPFARDYTVDIEEDRRALLRFGFGEMGRYPQAGDAFRVTYRIGGGERGNVRADTITHVVGTEAAILSVRNPLPALGGTDPEALEKARERAPDAFRTQKCCVTEQDYATIARQYPQITNAVARLNWSGNSPVVTLYVQREQGKPVDRTLEEKLGIFLDAYRPVGHTFVILGPYFVGLRVTLTVWLQRTAPRSITEKALTLLLSNTPGGFFAPDKFTFGQPVYQSQLLAAIMAVSGVERVEIEQFCRFNSPSATCEEVISPGSLEIIRLDNDETAPYNGRLVMRLESGL